MACLEVKGGGKDRVKKEERNDRREERSLGRTGEMGPRVECFPQKLMDLSFDSWLWHKNPGAMCTSEVPTVSDGGR